MWWLFGAPSPIETLLAAARTGRIEEVTELLASGAEVDGAGKFGNTALHEAAYWGHTDLVSLLLDAQASVHKTNEVGWTPLHEAARTGHEVVTTLLLAHDSRVDDSDHDGCSPLHQAAYYGHSGVVSLLLEAGANATLCNAVEGKTALAVARQRHKHSAVQLLDSALTAQLYAAIDGADARQVRRLIHAGATINSSHETHLSPLVQAVRRNYLPTICQLLKSNAAVDLCVGPDGISALAHAAALGHVEGVHLLLIAGADVDVRDAAGRTPLILAAALGYDEIVDALLVDGADPNAHDKSGRTPLTVAAAANHVSVARLLLAAGASKTARAPDDEPPIVVALRRGLREMAALLHHSEQPRTIIRKPIPTTNALWLGAGSYGVVHKTTFEGTVVAVKTAKTASNDVLLKEVAAMTAGSSPYLLPLIAAVAPVGSVPQLVTPFMDGGNLRQHLNLQKVGEPTAVRVSTWQIAWVVANALRELHSRGMLHRDVKSDNIFLSTTRFVQLGDFGTARTYDAEYMTEGTGTPYWIAPEVFNNGGVYNFAADVYSFGVVLTELDTMQLPYWDAPLKGAAVTDAVRTGALRPSLRDDCAPWFRALALQCMAQDPAARPSAESVVQVLEQHRDDPTV
ncbi:pfs, nacht and ankyrin domain protein [Achlya hypogyna]|uniref:Pfs, nacht and ankyrin domain protein n=1 Tax=Achlya hypogyna TaxID=1202772 RepID=A0A1V9YZS4_ACHHY|nr:pfs, nacht and ankyrin domain protein [Achlya hypogyna]